MIRKFPSLKRIFGWIEKIPRNRKLLLWKQEMDGFAGRWYAAFATRQPQASLLQMWPDCYSAHGASVAPWHVGFQLDSSAAGFDPCVRFFFFFFFVSSFDYTFHHAQLVKVVAMNNSVSRLIHFAPVPRVARGFAERTQWARRDRNRSGIFFSSNSSRKTRRLNYTRGGRGLFSRVFFGVFVSSEVERSWIRVTNRNFSIARIFISERLLEESRIARNVVGSMTRGRKTIGGSKFDLEDEGRKLCGIDCNYIN